MAVSRFSITAFTRLKPLRQKAIEHLMALHSRGLQHNDFMPRNVAVDDLKDPHRLVLIDLEHMTEHQCKRKIDIALYQYPVEWDAFGCAELHRAAENTDVWTPGTIRLTLLARF